MTDHKCNCGGDCQSPAVVTKDMLTDIFDLQSKLNATVTPWAKPDIVANYTPSEKMAAVSKFLDVLAIEVSEAKLATGARWWKVGKDTAGGLPHLAEELVDCLHFLISTYQMLGLTAEDVYNIYLFKNGKNHVRPDWERKL